MIEVGVLVDKLHGFEKADEIASFLESQNVKAVPGSASSCAISKWINRESGQAVTTSSRIKVWEDVGSCVEEYVHSEAMIKFIEKFDMRMYPNLEHS